MYRRTYRSTTPTCTACCTASFSGPTCPPRRPGRGRSWTSRLAWCRPAGAGPGTRPSWSSGRCAARPAGPLVRGARSTITARPARRSIKHSPACRAWRETRPARSTRTPTGTCAAGCWPAAARGRTPAAAPQSEATTRSRRGGVLARLREEATPGGLPLPELARLLRENATDVEPVRLKAVIESLERDGLARVMDASERPEHRPADAVAEERGPCATGPAPEGARASR